MTCKRCRRHHRRGMTLAEMMIALTITSLIALGVASMLHAASYGTSSRREIRRVVVRVQQLRSRLNDAIRTSRCVLASGEAASGNVYLVLWHGDADTAVQDKNRVNLSELELLEWQPGAKRLSSFRAATPPSPDPVYAATSDFFTVADQARTGGLLTETVWSDSVSDATVNLDQTVVLQARLVTWSLTLQHELVSEPIVGVMGCRCDPAQETCTPE